MTTKPARPETPTIPDELPIFATRCRVCSTMVAGVRGDNDPRPTYSMAETMMHEAEETHRQACPQAEFQSHIFASQVKPS